MTEPSIPNDLRLSQSVSTPWGPSSDRNVSPLTTPSARANSKMNILMVDDQPAKLLAYEAILSDLGENLMRAASGTEALGQLLKNDIAVVLIDVNMPEMDGFQLADLIRQHPRFDRTALIFVSAVNMSDLERRKLYEHGGVDYISVPVVPEILRAKVKLFVELRRKTLQLEAKSRALQSLSSRLMAAQDVERRRIARNLHDSLGQYLASIKMSLDFLDHCVSANGKAHLSSAVDSVEKCIAETRTISHLLHPPLLDEAGFVSAARLYVEGFSKRSGIEAKLDLPKEVRLSELTEITLFRILQESLTNVHRHSGSASVEIHVQVIGNEVVLVVQDFGNGMPLNVERGFQSYGFQPGVGLAGMRERAGDLGGTLEIQSNADGTSIIAKVPVSPHAKLNSVQSNQNLEKSSDAQ